MHNFGVNDWHTLRRATIDLLLHDHMIRIRRWELGARIFLVWWLPRQFHARGLRTQGMAEKLVKIEGAELVAHRCAERWLAQSTSIAWESSKFVWNRLPLVFIRMIIGAMRFIACIRLLASVNFIVKRVIFLFFPSMSATASILILASIDSIVLNKCFHLPIWTLFLIIIVEMWFSAIILPIMSVNTSVSWVSGITIWTPNCFEMEHIKICIFNFYFMKQINSQFSFRVSEGTHVAVLALINFIWVSLTKLYFILFRVVEFLNTIVSAEAIISQWTVWGLSNSRVRAYFASIHP